MQQDIQGTLTSAGPILHEIKLNLKQSFEPKLSSRKLDDGSMITSELEDMAPFISRKKMEEIKTKAFNI